MGPRDGWREAAGETGVVVLEGGFGEHCGGAGWGAAGRLLPWGRQATALTLCPHPAMGGCSAPT